MFETVFTVGSIHGGTIIELLDKGAVVSLPYGVEGFATPKHLVKEDGSQALLDEKLNFKIIEFNKDAKRIILSHSRIYEDEQRREKAITNVDKENDKGGDAVSSRESLEKPVLGNISELVELKERMKEGKK